ncbi:unnamed protein product [Ixodes pacificus]
MTGPVVYHALESPAPRTPSATQNVEHPRARVSPVVRSESGNGKGICWHERESGQTPRTKLATRRREVRNAPSSAAAPFASAAGVLLVRWPAVRVPEGGAPPASQRLLGPSPGRGRLPRSLPPPDRTRAAHPSANRKQGRDKRGAINKSAAAWARSGEKRRRAAAEARSSGVEQGGHFVLEVPELVQFEREPLVQLLPGALAAPRRAARGLQLLLQPRHRTLESVVLRQERLRTHAAPGGGGGGTHLEPVVRLVDARLRLVLQLALQHLQLLEGSRSHRLHQLHLSSPLETHLVLLLSLTVQEVGAGAQAADLLAQLGNGVRVPVARLQLYHLRTGGRKR